MKFKEISFDDGVCAIVELNGDTYTVSSHNPNGGVCSCCADWNYSDEDEMIVKKVVNIKTMQVIYSSENNK